MSATRYPLRNRLAQNAPAAASTRSKSPLAGNTYLETGMDFASTVPTSGSLLEDEAATVRPKQVTPASASPCLYSDVAASRPSSAASQYDNTQLDAGISETCSAPIMNPLDEEDDTEARPWTLVESKRARRRQSFGSYQTVPSTSIEEQAGIVHCYENAHIDSNRKKSLRAGTSKEQGVNPVSKLELSESDVNAQREAMNTWKSVRNQDHASKRSTTGRKNSDRGTKDIPLLKNSKYKSWVERVPDIDAPKASAPAAADTTRNPSTSKTRMTPMSDTLMERIANAVRGHRRPSIRQERQSLDIQPVSQIAPGSYLGRAMNRVEKSKHSPSDPSDTSSTGSSESLSSSDSESGNRGGSGRSHHHLSQTQY
jgi:hypothetical protein